MSAELATLEGEVIDDAPRAPLTLFGTDDPVAVVERATVMADALADVIKAKGLSTHIGGREHIQVGGWTLLGSMLGVFAEIQWSRPVEGGWEARAVARTLSGAIVGASEAMCTRKERTWGNRDEYALRSMAQTRAVSKALRLPLGFIVELAGYSATPLEEVDDQPERGGERAARPATTRSAPARTPEEAGLLDELLAVPGMSHAQASLLADAVGVHKGERANADQLREMLARATQPGSALVPAGGEAASAPASPSTLPPEEHPDSSGTGAATDQPDQEGSLADRTSVQAEEAGSPPAGSTQPAPTLDDILEATGGELVPPKPGTDEYKALDSKERATARSYWANPPEEETLAEQLRTLE